MSRSKDEPITFIVTERDIDNPFLATGAIIFEQYVNASPEEVRQKAKQHAVSGKYGRVWVGTIKEEQLTRIHANGVAEIKKQAE